jgi:hypothetical protein
MRRYDNPVMCMMSTDGRQVCRSGAPGLGAHAVMQPDGNIVLHHHQSIARRHDTPQ